jgi:hypothetical protein
LADRNGQVADISPSRGYQLGTAMPWIEVHLIENVFKAVASDDPKLADAIASIEGENICAA